MFHTMRSTVQDSFQVLYLLLLCRSCLLLKSYFKNWYIFLASFPSVVANLFLRLHCPKEVLSNCIIAQWRLICPYDVCKTDAHQAEYPFLLKAFFEDEIEGQTTWLLIPDGEGYYNEKGISSHRTTALECLNRFKTVVKFGRVAEDTYLKKGYKKTICAMSGTVFMISRDWTGDGRAVFEVLYWV